MKQETYTLLIMDNNPETIDFYLIPNSVIEEKDRKILEESHGIYIGSGLENYSVYKLNSMLCDKVEWCHPGYLYKATEWVKYRLDDNPIEANITNVYKFGFFM